MLPRLRNDPGYLDRAGYEVTDSKGRRISSSSINWWAYGGKVPYNVRQTPSEANALGELKILFPNKHAIYMHDTPQKELFSRDERAFSHGCVRLQDPRGMAAAVLGKSVDYIADKLKKGHSMERTTLKIPVYVAYFTAWPDKNGKVEYFGDVYERDARVELALEKTDAVRVPSSDPFRLGISKPEGSLGGNLSIRCLRLTVWVDRCLFRLQLRKNAKPTTSTSRGGRRKESSAIGTIIKSHNQRLYRLARAIVKRDEEAEDVLQEAYLRAFSNLESFRGDSTLSTWLSRITINEALTRLRKGKRLSQRGITVEAIDDDARIIPFPGNVTEFDPERLTAQRELLRLVERAIDDMAGPFRSVFVARVVEGLSVEETAELLEIEPSTVKTRLHRARKQVRQRLEDEIGPVLLDAFPFAGKRCDRLTATVLDKLGL